MSPKRFYYAYGARVFWECVIFLLFMLFFYTPLLNNIIVAFGDVYRFPDIIPSKLGFKWWDFVFGQDQLVSSVSMSFLIASLTTVVTLLICIPAAYAIALSLIHI